MNCVLGRFTDNPIIARMVTWPPSKQRVITLRGSHPVFRKPFIEIEYEGGKTKAYSFPKSAFSNFWAEAVVIIETVTDIEVLSEFDYKPIENKSALVSQVLAEKQECIDDSNKMFDAGVYGSFLDQFGQNCKDIPQGTLENIALARKETDS